jgi:hypothetical protein
VVAVVVAVAVVAVEETVERAEKLEETVERAEIDSRLSGFLFRILFSLHIILGKHAKVSNTEQPHRIDMIPTVLAVASMVSMVSVGRPMYASKKFPSVGTSDCTQKKR